MKIFLKETIISLLLSLMLILFLALLISQTNLKEKIINPSIIAISSVAILSGSIRVTKTKKKNGLINGILLGLIYIFGMYFISSIVLKDFSLNIKSLLMLLCGLIGGMIGGVIGVNM